MGKREKKTEKTVKNVMENGGKWRFFEGQSAIFAVPGADGPRSQRGSLPELTSVESGSVEPPPAPGIGSGAPFFTAMGTDRPVRAMTAGRTVGFTHPTRAHSAPR